MRAGRFGSSDDSAALLRFAGPRLAAALFAAASVPLLVLSRGIGPLEGIALLLLIVQAIPASTVLAGGDFDRARDLSHFLFPFGCLGAVLIWPLSAAGALGASLLLPFEAALRGDAEGLRRAVPAASGGTVVTAALQADGSAAALSGMLAASFPMLAFAVLGARAMLRRAEEAAVDRTESAAAGRVRCAMTDRPMLLLTAHGYVVEANPAACALPGDEAIPRDWTALVHPADRPSLFAALGLARPGGAEIRLSLRIRSGTDWNQTTETSARLRGIRARDAVEGRLVCLALSSETSGSTGSGTGAGSRISAYDVRTVGDQPGSSAMPDEAEGIRPAA
jgi:hypothetical protein